MKLPATLGLRPYDQNDWYGLAGSIPLPGMHGGPFITTVKLTHESITEEVNLIVAGDEVEASRPQDRVIVAFILEQGQGVSALLAREDNEELGGAELMKQGLKVEEAEALLNALTKLPQPFNVAKLKDMGFTTI